MAVEHLEQVFEECLDRAYYMEQKLVKILDKMAKRATDQNIKDAFEIHKEETMEQVARLEEVFNFMNMTPKKIPAHEIDGLAEDEKEFDKEKPTNAIKDFHSLGAAVKMENLEIGHYEVLILIAKKIDLHGVVSLLKDNLKEEERALKKVQKLSKRFDFTTTIHPDASMM